MKRRLLVAGFLILCVCLQVCMATGSTKVVPRMTQIPLSFTQNQGQWDESISFRVRAGGFTAWFTENGIYYQFGRRIPAGTTSPDRRYDWGMANQTGLLPRGDDSVITMAISATLVGANPKSQIIGAGLIDYRCNYFIGIDPTNWRTDVPNFNAVVYEDIYPSIDLKYYSSGDGRLEYDFMIEAGADLSQIAIRYDGAENVCVDDAGQLVVETEWGRVTEQVPRVYQYVDGERKEVGAEYLLREGNVFGFRLDEEYLPQYAVVIDPVLSYSTYLGGSGDDYGGWITVDNNGNAYIAGTTMSADFPTYNAYQPSYGGGYFDAYVTKLNSSGNGLVYSTYLGGSMEDFGWGIAVDNDGCAYVTGETFSADFPIQGGYQSLFGGGECDAYVTKLSNSGDTILYSTYLGGSARRL